jgi:hypothetical protein
MLAGKRLGLRNPEFKSSLGLSAEPYLLGGWMFKYTYTWFSILIEYMGIVGMMKRPELHNRVQKAGIASM